MKKILSLLVLIPLFLGACGTKEDALLDTNKVYFFYSNTCPHCHHALDYINQKYPNLQLTMVNISNTEGYDLFVSCAKNFKLGDQIGTPLFCMGDKYIMGWSLEYEAKFDEYVKPYIK